MKSIRHNNLGKKKAQKGSEKAEKVEPINQRLGKKRLSRE